MAIVKQIFIKDEKGCWRQGNKIFLEISSKKNEKRDISFITCIGYDKLQHDSIKGFCHWKFKANFIIDGLDIDGIPLDSQLVLGNARIRVMEKGKECHKGCPALKQGNSCTLGKHIFFGEVVKAGFVKMNDSIII